MYTLDSNFARPVETDELNTQRYCLRTFIFHFLPSFAIYIIHKLWVAQKQKAYERTHSTRHCFISFARSRHTVESYNPDIYRKALFAHGIFVIFFILVFDRQRIYHCRTVTTCDYCIICRTKNQTCNSPMTLEENRTKRHWHVRFCSSIRLGKVRTKPIWSGYSDRKIKRLRSYCCVNNSRKTYWGM